MTIGEFVPWGLTLAALIVQAVLIEVQRRRTKRLLATREMVEKLMIFTAWMSTEASGAPPRIREMAKAALPPGAEVDVTFVSEPGKAVH